MGAREHPTARIGGFVPLIEPHAGRHGDAENSRPRFRGAVELLARAGDLVGTQGPRGDPGMSPGL